MSQDAFPHRIRVTVFALTGLCANMEKCISIVSSQVSLFWFCVFHRAVLCYHFIFREDCSCNEGQNALFQFVLSQEVRADSIG